MDREAKLSFIPKKPLARMDLSGRRPVSLFLTLSFSLVVITAAVYGGLYFYATALTKEIEGKKTTLQDTRKKFDLSIIEKARSFRSQTESARNLIDNHVALSVLLDYLGGITLQSVGYDSFEYVNNEGATDITLSGRAPDYASLALQRDVLSREAEKKNISSFSFGNYRLDENGNVGFSWQASLNMEPFLYKKIITNTVSPGAEEAMNENEDESVL